MALTQASLFPLFSVVFALLAFFIGYAIAVAKDHVDAFLPFISDCGTRLPESGIFGQLLNLSSFCLIVTVYFVHRNFVVQYEKIEHKYLGNWKVLSICLMFLGVASAVGASMVANFQEGNYLPVHNTGAFLFFIGITIYFWGQVLIGIVLRPKSTNMVLTVIRLALCIAITLFLIFHIVCLLANPFVKKVIGKIPEKPDTFDGIERYKKGSPFYWNHIAQTLSEWILAFLLEAFVLTFTFELAYTKLEAPTVKRQDSFKSSTPEVSAPDRTFYTNHVAPMDPMLSSLHPLEVPHSQTMPMRRLPRIDAPYGTYSRTGNGEATYAAYKPGKEEVAYSTYSRTGKDGFENIPLNSSVPSYDRSRVVSNYDQYQYF